jgi:hypothetical protein
VGAAPQYGATVSQPRRSTTLLSRPLEATPSACAQDEAYAGTDRRQRPRRPRPFGDGSAPHRTTERSSRSHAPAQGRQPPAPPAPAEHSETQPRTPPRAQANTRAHWSRAETRSSAHAGTKTRSRSTPRLNTLVRPQARRAPFCRTLTLDLAHGRFAKLREQFSTPTPIRQTTLPPPDVGATPMRRLLHRNVHDAFAPSVRDRLVVGCPAVGGVRLSGVVGVDGGPVGARTDAGGAAGGRCCRCRVCACSAGSDVVCC